MYILFDHSVTSDYLTFFTGLTHCMYTVVVRVRWSMPLQN